MMGAGTGTGGHGCERARGWASLALDGELSQLESALLDAHLGRCAACAEVVTDMNAATLLLRTAPPSRPTRSLAVVPKRRIARPVAVRLAAAATLAALAAGLGVLAGSLDGDSELPSVPAGSDIALLPSRDDELDERRRLRPQPSGPLVQPLGPAGVRGV